VAARTKRYFKSNSTGISKTSLAFLIRWFDVKDSTVKYDGPFFDEEQAEDRLHSYLKRGVCCWIIRYND
tara:strand:+ start:1345 stop:1551 length:207 start_codon:yes stop_codon:yes gene_type:complete